MQVITDRRGRVVAAFAHYSDAVIFIAGNAAHALERHDEPGLDKVMAEWIGRPTVGDGEEKKQIG